MAPVPEDEERAQLDARQWRLAQINLGVAVGMLVIAGLWWFSDATWEPPTFTVLAVLLTVAAASNLRQLRRNAARRSREKDDPR